MRINERILALRKAMKAQQIDAYLIPSNDPHQSEYVADHWKSRQWISGFTGSAGIAIVTQDHAGIWTDSRYFLQAENELANSEFVLHKQGVPHAPEHIAWLTKNLPSGSVIGCDGMLFSLSQIRYINNRLYGTGIELNTDFDFISKVWASRPALPVNKIFAHDPQFAGQDRMAKMARVKAKMKNLGASHYFISTLDDIAWLLNIRGRDVAYNPVAICYFILGENTSYLFIERGKVEQDLEAELGTNNILIKDYDSIQSYLGAMGNGERLLIDPQSTSLNLFKAIPDQVVLKGHNLVRDLKAIKSEVEAGHIRNAMIKDGVALTRLYRWLDAELEKRSISEVELAEQLITFRKEQDHYYGESFGAIVGYKGNGAIVHYRPEPETCAQIKKEGILLLDSGGQYEDGTTDITRTIALGPPTEEQKRNYTLVLKGHIALATIKFPRGTTGMQLDSLARMYLWKEGLNYGHGTGHGVGFFLNVHEPPQGFASNPSTGRGTTAFLPGMFSSNEPGCYKTEEYGIRIENLILCVEEEPGNENSFLKFESLTLFPIATDLMEMNLLSQEEKDWLNTYHEEVYEKLAPHVTQEEQQWLKEKCQKI